MKLFIKRYNILFIISISIIFKSMLCHKGCGGVRKTNHTFFDGYINDENHKRFLQAEWTTIRIYYDYTTITQQLAKSDPSILISIKKILEQTREIIQNLIKVKRLPRKISISTCGKDVVPSRIISEQGVDADIIVFPLIDMLSDTGAEAFASSCVNDLRTGKPIAGFISFTKNFNNRKLNWLEYNTYLAFHEMTHILIFNEILWTFFKDSNGITIPLNKIISTSIVNGLPRQKIITPRVVEAAKKHYNCDSLDGVELENNGGEGTRNNHWEARTMLTDYMIGIDYDDVTISEITLGLFEDSGWYKVNHYTGGLFRFGKNEGCNFLTSKCIVNGTSQFREYCDNNNVPHCTNSRLNRGACLIKNYIEPLIKDYSYYDDRFLGGFPLADYCSIPIANYNNNSYLSSHCVFGLTDIYPSELEEVISLNSACFISSLVNDKYCNVVSNYVDKSKAICYKFSCDNKNKNVIVSVGNSKAVCSTNGGTATIKGYSGKLYCPDYNSICTKEKECVSLIDCALKKVEPSGDTFKYNYILNTTIPTEEGVILTGKFGINISKLTSTNKGTEISFPISSSDIYQFTFLFTLLLFYQVFILL